MNNFMQALYKKTLCVFAIVIIGYIFFVNTVTTCVFYTYEKTMYLQDSLLANLFWLLVFSILVLAIYRSGKIGTFNQYLKDDNCYAQIKKILLGVLLLLSVLWTLSTQLQPDADEVICMQVAEQLVNGDYGACNASGGYIAEHISNRGLILFEVLLSLTFGSNNYIVFSLLNCVAIMLIGKESAELGEHIGLSRFSQMMMIACEILFFPLEVYAFYIYGNIMALAFALTAIKYAYSYFGNQSVSALLKCAGCICCGIWLN